MVAFSRMIFALPLLATGCMPGVYTSRPEFRGAVIAAGTGEPVAGASVAVEEDRIGTPPATVATDAGGMFVIPRSTKFWVYWLMQAQGEWDYVIRVEAPGFEESSAHVSRVGQMPPRRIEDLRIELSPRLGRGG